ncbi:hypothetical protein M9H77_04977 [Catharanthus roseus]|uniref:Uncharacterized protein n=1 Tax=Catharanthus roseus TaxID=4058 RepID=A0ACC0CFK8_CATRO|nr:hypothetical protein M9H77_04977 [Catharanthus roseus]
MNFLVHQHLEYKISAFTRKLISTLAILENPSNFPDQNAKRLVAFNPVDILKNPTKSRNYTLNETKIIHCHLLRTNGVGFSIFAANTLLDFYFKCGGIDYALKLFEKIPDPNVVTWNMMVSGCNKNFLFEDSWRYFCRMHFLGLDMNQYTYGAVLSACGALECPFWGEQVYGLVRKNGFFSNGYVRTGMIDLFSGNHRFEDALRVFYDVICENVVCWNAIISGAVKNKKNWIALGTFVSMCQGFSMPNGFTFSSVLTACAAIEELGFGKGVQGWAIKCGADEDIFVGTAIVDMYAKCGSLDEAVQQFWLMPVRNVVSWTAIISGFAQKGDFVTAVKFFKEMRSSEEDINSYTITSVLTACANPAEIKEAIQIHCWTFKSGFYMNSVVKASLINAYGKMGALELSERVFADMEHMEHLGTWANMISAFAQSKRSGRAIYLFQRMLQEDIKPEKFCTSSVLSVTDSLDLGKQIHSYTVKTGLISDVSVGSSLFTMYSKCGSLEESYKVFDLLQGKDTVSWASMIAGFVSNGSASNAIDCFREMLDENIVPDEMVLTAVLNACSALHSLKTGKEVHGFAIRRGLGVQNFCVGGLVNMYSKCGDLCSARKIFDRMPEKDEITWSSMVSGYAQQGYTAEGLGLFQDMLMADVEIDDFTMSSVLGLVSHSGELGIGTQIHATVVKLGLESEVTVGCSLLMMYSNVGRIEECQKVFEKIKNHDVISWTAMIASCAQHGKGAEALHTFELMKKSGAKPDSVTFTGVLSACSHSGLVEEGYFHLQSMKKDYGIEPNYRHYCCMVDLLGRAGRLEEAEKFINDMPLKPDGLVWGTLLAACQVHGNIDLGKLAAEKVMELGTLEAGTYVSLSNICADVGQWHQVLKLRSEMKGTGVVKEPGWSSL